jgi:redox-sensitive bicupin YhaK (pirin superfamily)
MIQVRSFDSLGKFRNEWLNARHHFSFGGYHDPARMGVGGLRVWNDDEIAPGTGFGAHPHRDMEIITYVREGAITHRDNLGNEGRTEAGDVQVMHAGTGITHAEYNLEATPTRIFQMWLMPNKAGVAPGWGARAFPMQGADSLNIDCEWRARHRCAADARRCAGVCRPFGGGGDGDAGADAGSGGLSGAGQGHAYRQRRGRRRAGRGGRVR